MSRDTRTSMYDSTTRRVAIFFGLMFLTATATFMAGDALVVESAVLLYRSRGDRNPPSLLSAGRVDTLVATPDGLRLAERLIEIDESVLRTQNLAIFL